MALTRSTLVAMASGAVLALGAGGLAVASTSGAFAGSTPSPGGTSSPTAPSSDGSRTPRPSSTGPSGSPGDKGDTDRRGPFGRHHRGGGGFGWGAGGAMLHGEIVVADPQGATKTMLVQQGEVTGVSGSTVTVKSSDGYTVAWTTSAETRTGRSTEAGDLSGFAAGDQVHVVGTKTGDGAGSATAIHERGDKQVPDRRRT
jgi:hypothetical protein